MLRSLLARGAKQLFHAIRGLFDQFCDGIGVRDVDGVAARHLRDAGLQFSIRDCESLQILQRLQRAMQACGAGLRGVLAMKKGRARCRP